MTTTRISAHALVLDDVRRILVCRIASHIVDGGRWTSPGGGLEFGEPPEAGARGLPLVRLGAAGVDLAFES